MKFFLPKKLESIIFISFYWLMNSYFKERIISSPCNLINLSQTPEFSTFFNGFVSFLLSSTSFFALKFSPISFLKTPNSFACKEFSKFILQQNFFLDYLEFLGLKKNSDIERFLWDCCIKK